MRVKVRVRVSVSVRVRVRFSASVSVVRVRFSVSVKVRFGCVFVIDFSLPDAKIRYYPSFFSAKKSSFFFKQLNEQMNANNPKYDRFGIYPAVKKLVCIGDIHGDYEQYLTILRDSGLIDARLNWAGGKTHLVQMGDLPDRGPDSLKIMQHMKKLQKQARREKG